MPKFTFEQFEIAYNQLSGRIERAAKEENNKDYEKFSYMLLDLCTEYPQFNFQLCYKNNKN